MSTMRETLGLVAMGIGRRARLLVAASLCGAAMAASSAPGNLIVATTTSTQDSGLLDVLVPMFEKQTGYRVKTIAVGTGKALSMAKRGDADVVLVHAPARERELVDGGFTIDRRLVMHNDFIVVGPSTDAAGVDGMRNAAEAMSRIAAKKARFVSRGDNSGTHFREQSLWQAAGVEPAGEWYLESGQGMGATLMIASEKGAYALTDRGTYLALKAKTVLVPRVEGDAMLLNVYSVMAVNPKRFPKVNQAGAQAFSEFMVSVEAQEVIKTFGMDKFGQPLFFPDAGKDESALGG